MLETFGRRKRRAGVEHDGMKAKHLGVRDQGDRNMDGANNDEPGRRRLDVDKDGVGLPFYIKGQEFGLLLHQQWLRSVGGKAVKIWIAQRARAVVCWARRSGVHR